MRAVDTNLLVRLATRDDPAQVAAAEDFVAKGAWVSHLVLAETSWVLASVYERSPAEIATAIEMILDHVNLSVEDADVVAAALGHLSKTAKVGFSDCLILEIARKAGHLPLGTLDGNLGRLDGAERLRSRRG